MMFADCCRLVALVALAIVAFAGPAQTGALVAIAVVLGAGEGLFLPGSFAIIPSLLPDDELQAGNAISTALTQASVLLGPVVGGVLVALVGAGAGFAIDAGSFVISAATLVAVRQTRPGAGAVSTDAVEGEVAPDAPVSLLRMLARERVLQVLIVIVVAANLGSGGVSEVALPALAHGPPRADAAGYGLLLAAFGLGSLVGALLAATRGNLRRPALTASIVSSSTPCSSPAPPTFRPTRCSHSRSPPLAPATVSATSSR